MIEDKNPQRTSISELGEFGLIDHLTKYFEIKQKSTVKGIGDDAAVLDFKAKKIVVTTDLLVEHVHFDLSYMPLEAFGIQSHYGQSFGCVCHECQGYTNDCFYCCFQSVSFGSTGRIICRY